MTHNCHNLSISTSALQLEVALTPWDQSIFKCPVGTISYLCVKHPGDAKRDFSIFENWRKTCDYGLISCRLPHNALQESKLLEANGFRFIEMVLHPQITKTQNQTIPDQGLIVSLAAIEDLPRIRAIAEVAFKNERFHVDPLIDPALGNKRYGQWVSNVFNNPAQMLIKIEDATDLIAFFIYEKLPGGVVYWHLTAVSPKLQGKGYGYKVWQQMIRYHYLNGAESISTTISARNIAVLNLYSKLCFQFPPPQMTFHWVKE